MVFGWVYQLLIGRAYSLKRTGVDYPFYTDNDWSDNITPIVTGDYGNDSRSLGYVFFEQGKVWGSDDDTDIEYMYQHLLDQHNVSMLTGEQIREGWLKHIYSNEDAPIYGRNIIRENSSGYQTKKPII